MPGNLLRHPDMPRGLFRALWASLRAGDPTAAFLLNRAGDGAPVWGFMLLMPVEGGFISIRLAPGGPSFEAMTEAYAQMLSREAAGQSDENVLETEAISRGFSNYMSYMATALSQQMAERDQQLGRESDQRTRILTDMNAALERVVQEQMGLVRNFDALQLIPNNMRIVASRLEPSGGPVSAISENYKASSLVISQRLHGFVGARDSICDRVSREVARTLILLGCCRLIAELLRQPQREEDGTDWPRECAFLERIETRFAAEARSAMLRAVDNAAALNRASVEVRRLMLGLDTIRVLGRVESSRLREAAGLASTIDQLDAFHAEIKTRLEAIMQLSERVGSALEGYLRNERPQ